MTAQKLIDSVYFIPNATNIGIIACKNEKSKTHEIYLVDTGMTSADGKHILQELAELFPDADGGFSVKTILSTHSHADHSGGNKYIMEQTGCELWATENEAGSMSNPFLQSAVIWGGNPISEITGPYYTAEAAAPTHIIHAADTITLNSAGKIAFLALPGHYFEMTGILFTNTHGESVLFAGDAIFGREHILKYWIPFLYDVRQFKQTLDRLLTVDAVWFVPSHGKPVQRIDETAEMNKIAILSTEFCILHVLRKKDLPFEDIVKQVADTNDITLKTTQFALISCTLRSYMTYLAQEKKVSYYVKENKMYWHLEPDGMSAL